jgi:hypothetical protein
MTSRVGVLYSTPGAHRADPRRGHNNMRNISLLTLALIALSAALLLDQRPALGAGAALNAPTIQIAPDLEVLELQFGELQGGQEQPRFVPGQRIRLEAGRAYGWRMRVRTTRAQVRWQEDLRLPRAPQQWGISQHVQLSSDRRRAVTDMASVPAEGWIENFWWIADGDPPGTYEVDVRIEGQRVGDTRFEVY